MELNHNERVNALLANDIATYVESEGRSVPHVILRRHIESDASWRLFVRHTLNEWTRYATDSDLPKSTLIFLANELRATLNVQNA